MDRQNQAVEINQRKLQRLKNHASTIIEEGSIKEQSILQGEGYDLPALSIAPQRSRTGGNTTSFQISQERTINEQPKIPYVSKWRRFINFLGCSNICVQSSEIEPYFDSNNTKSQNNRNKQEHSKSLFISFRSNNNPNPTENQNENAQSFLDLPSRQPSNSSFWLFNILNYSASGYCALKFGNFNFLQIPVRFERIRAKPKMTLYQNISQDLQTKDNSYFTLIIQEFFDSELSIDLSSNSEYTLCVFANITTSIDPNLNESTTSNLANSDGLKSTPSMSQSCHQEQYFYQQIQATIPKKQLSKIDFLRCHDLSVTVQQEQFDKIYIIPTSLKQQGNAFNDDFTMHQEFKRRFVELLNEYNDVLYKTVFLLPKYCRIREIMMVIFECFKNSSLSLGELNFGIQFHAYINTHQDVDAIALVFNYNQNVDTLAAISHRVFSNIFPEKSSQQKKDQKNNKKDLSEIKESLDGSLPQYILSNNKDQYDNDNSAQTNQTEYEFGEEYIEELSKCTFKQFFGFLKEINACFIVYQDNTFQYRTHIIDTMLKHSVISRSFVQYLLTNIENFDESNLQLSQSASNQSGQKSSTQSISPSKFSQDKLSKNTLSSSNLSKSKDKNQSTFKEYFMKNSSQYTSASSISSKAKLNIVFEGSASYSEPSDLASRNPSDYEHQQMNFRQISKPFQNNYPRSPVEHKSNILEINNITQDQADHSSVYSSEQQQLLPSQNGISTSSQQIPHEIIKNRTKQISCNCFSTSTNNKHIGFKSKKRSSQTNIQVDPDILSHTTASRIADKSKNNLAVTSLKNQGKKDIV